MNSRLRVENRRTRARATSDLHEATPLPAGRSWIGHAAFRDQCFVELPVPHLSCPVVLMSAKRQRSVQDEIATFLQKR